MTDDEDPNRDRPAHVQFVRRELVEPCHDAFDRIDFALRALRLLRPQGLTVAVFESRSSVTWESGRDLGRGQSARWGMLAVPPHASRADIAVAVARLAGRTQDPYVLDLILMDSKSSA